MFMFMFMFMYAGGRVYSQPAMEKRVFFLSQKSTGCNVSDIFPPFRLIS